MKRLYLSLLSCLCALCAWSQQDNLYRYDRIPDAFQQVFNDVAAECVTCLVNTANGQYWGQSRDGVLYGYGIFINNNGSQWVGQYRDGECIFGILMDDKTANVGSKTFYSLYDLTTGESKTVYSVGPNTNTTFDNSGVHTEVQTGNMRYRQPRPTVSSR